MIKVILIGAGGRGTAYVKYMKQYPDRFQIVGVADPIRERREHVKELFQLEEEQCYEKWQDILDRPRMADLAVIATMDEEHYAPAMQAMELGYHLLLEKPVAPTVKECVDIANKAKERKVKVLVCHVLRYAPFYKKVKQMLLDGDIGEVMSVDAVEAVGHIHQSHSFVRGDWHREDETTPMILAKCCHDLDMIQWLIDKPCKEVSSFGDLTHFRPENAPKGAPVRCYGSECPAAKECPYQCQKVYIDDEGYKWMRRAVARGYAKDDVPTDEEVIAGLKNTNFGACVYHAGNDVVDHQVVNMQFEGGVTATLSMNAFNEGGRYIRIFGTKGELYAHANSSTITLFTFNPWRKTEIPVSATEESIAGGHGGGDEGMIGELYDYMTDNYHGYSAADIDTSVQNHLIAFAAEYARWNHTVETMDEFRKRV